MGSTYYSTKVFFGAAARLLAACLITASLAAPAAGQSNGVIENRYLQAIMYGVGQRDSINLSGRFEIVDRLTGETILLASHLGDLGIQKLGSFITVRIDGGAPPPGTPSTRGWDVIMGDGSQGNAGWIWTRPPLTLNGRIFASGETTAPAPRIEIATEVFLIGDMAQFKFTIT